MLSDDDRAFIFEMLTKIRRKKVTTVDDLLSLGLEQFLSLMEKVPDELLPFVVSLFKSDSRGKEFFYTLTENLDQDTAQKTRAFLRRYQEILLSKEESSPYYNPLIAYLPEETFHDLAFIQSRQPFFLRQTIDTINEFLQTVCSCPISFEAGQQEQAWEWFWNYLLKL